MSEGAKIIVLALFWKAVGGKPAKGATAETVFLFNCLMPNIRAKDCGSAIFKDSAEVGFLSGSRMVPADEILKISSFMITLKCERSFQIVVNNFE